MLEELFTSKTRVRILGLLLFSPESYHLREISRRVGVSAAYVGRELANLEKLGLVVRQEKGNLLLFSANPSSPIASELKRIFLKTDFLGSAIQDALEGDIRYAIVFGSFAKGEESAGSDIDLLIVGKMDRDRLSKTIYKLEKNLYREINYIVWSVPEFGKKIRDKHMLLGQIVGNPFVMLVGDADEFRKAVEGRENKEG